MKGKITFLVGGAIGYVLGTRAGREQYEQIKNQAQGIWTNPKFQEKATQAQDFAKEKAPEVQRQVADAAAKAAGAAKEKVGSSSSDASDTPTDTYPAAASSDLGSRG